MFRIVLVSIFLFLTAAASAQNVLDSTFIEVENGEAFLSYLNRVENNTNLRFFYLEEWVKPFKLKSEQVGLSLRQILNSQLEDSGIQFVFLFNYEVIFFKDTDSDQRRDSLIESAIAKHKKINRIVIGDPTEFVPGRSVILQGHVSDKDNNASLTGVSVYIHELNRGFLAESTGKYKILLPGGEYLISFRLLNYQEKLVNLTIYADGEVNVEMEEVPTILNEVIISDQAFRRTGQSSIKMTELKRQPSFLGEPDLIKQIQYQAGVSTVSEASSGYNVRGGGADQNLVLFDDVPIFSTSHALGFFAAFNIDAVGDASFYKGGIPAEFGGRVSSVLNLTAKEGSYQKWHGTGGIGFVSSTLTIGGPVKKDASSLIFSIRSTYSDWILDFLQTKYKNISDGSVFFCDGSIKYSDIINRKSRFSASTYFSRDQFSLANDTVNRWENITATLKYGHTIEDNLSYSIGLSLGRYAYEVSDMDSPTAFNLNYSATYPSIKIDFNSDKLNHKFSFGFHSTYHHFKPGKLEPASSQSNVQAISMPTESALESAIYFSDAFDWGERLNMELGLRLSLFNRIGGGTVYRYEEGKPIEPRNTIDSLQYGTGELMKSYLGPEPRFALRYILDLNSSIKVGYNRMYQYVHLISNAAAISPIDIWQISNTYFKPQISDQLSVGYFRNFKNRSIECYVEGYYKLQHNVLDFKDGPPLILNSQLETALISGSAESYGVELSMNNSKGRLIGGVNYTFSRSLRKTNGEFDSEKINMGKTYPSNFDQPHIVNINWKYSFNRRLFFTGIFTYHTGRPVSLPISGYIVDGIPVSDFSERNNYRIPDYHRLDIAFVLEGSNRRNKRVEGNWSLSLYNVYGRKNPYSIFLVARGNGVLQPYKLSLIGVPVPSLSYSFKF